jgi:hypothetical protein
MKRPELKYVRSNNNNISNTVLVACHECPEGFETLVLPHFL